MEVKQRAVRNPQILILCGLIKTTLSRIISFKFFRFACMWVRLLFSHKKNVIIDCRRATKTKFSTNADWVNKRKNVLEMFYK